VSTPIFYLSRTIDLAPPVIPEGAGPVNPQFRAADLLFVVLRLFVGAPG
jgi:hypothetical protein